MLLYPDREQFRRPEVELRFSPAHTYCRLETTRAGLGTPQRWGDRDNSGRLLYGKLTFLFCVSPACDPQGSSRDDLIIKERQAD